MLTKKSNQEIIYRIRLKGVIGHQAVDWAGDISSSHRMTMRPCWWVRLRTRLPCAGSWINFGISISPYCLLRESKMKTIRILILNCLLLSACVQSIAASDREVLPENPTSEPTQANLPNPASAFCEGQGNRLEIRTAADGSQAGVCIFPDGSECDGLTTAECTLPTGQSHYTPIEIPRLLPQFFQPRAA
jgi:putative hemolysin